MSMLGDPSKLSKAARDKYSQLLGQVKDLIDKDQSREPRLTESEKAEVEGLEARHVQLQPIISKLEDSLDKRITRLNSLQRNNIAMVLDGGNVDELADEFNRLGRAIEILNDALRAAMFEDSTGAMTIAKIKELARNRELKEERT